MQKTLEEQVWLVPYIIHLNLKIQESSFIYLLFCFGSKLPEPMKWQKSIQLNVFINWVGLRSWQQGSSNIRPVLLHTGNSVKQFDKPFGSIQTRCVSHTCVLLWQSGWSNDSIMTLFSFMLHYANSLSVLMKIHSPRDVKQLKVKLVAWPTDLADNYLTSRGFFGWRLYFSSRHTSAVQTGRSTKHFNVRNSTHQHAGKDGKRILYQTYCMQYKWKLTAVALQFIIFV